MSKLVNLMDSLLFLQKNLAKGNRWHIYKESDYSTMITYCNLNFEPQDASSRITNDEQYEWATGKKWQPENICPKCVKNLELVVA
jgi:hypothetical protein